jgi:hypothetical protein
MKKKAKKATSKPKKAVKKPVATKKPAPKAKKAKPAKKSDPKKKPVAKKPVPKPVAKKVVKPEPKAVAKKQTKPAKVVSKPVAKPVSKPETKPAKAAPKATGKIAVPAKPPVRKLTPAEIQKLGLKPLPKALPTQVKDDKRPKGYYTLEYLINSSPDILFEFISSASGLEKWFAEKVGVKENIFHFIWDKDETKDAELIALKEREFARFRWLDQNDSKKYFEFRIQIDDLTSEVALIVSDFADTPQELEDSRLLWNAQIHDLLHALGGAP